MTTKLKDNSAATILADVAPISLQNSFPRWHLFCDRCEASLEGRRESGEIETAAGSFRYVFCGKCCDARYKMSKVARESSTRRAMVKHAARYSPHFGAFVAHWFGVVHHPPREVTTPEVPKRIVKRNASN